MHAAVTRALFDESVGRWPSDLAEKFGWILHRVEFPIIDCEFTQTGRTPLRVRMDYSGWNDEPPSVSLLNSAGDFLQTLPENPTGVFHQGPHEITQRPFVCMAGTKEFHTHSSHVHEKWDQFRDKPGFGLSEILTKLWHAWLKGKG